MTSFYPIDIADEIARKPLNEGLLQFNALPQDVSEEVFEYLPFRYQVELLKELPSQRVGAQMNALSPDDRTALLEELPPSLVNQLLKYLSPAERALSLRLLNYPENSVGRLMTPDYIAIRLDWTVGHVLDYIRANGHDSETINVIYAVDDQGKLVDDFRVRQLLLAPMDVKMEALADHTFIALHVQDNEETAVQVFRKYGRVALPVVDSEGVLLGIVTFDDIMAIAVKEDTKDMQMVGGVSSFEEPYLTIPLLQLFRKRVGWLVILFIGELLTASAMGYFEDEISRAVVLALFIPLIISSGGNAGSQASTLVVRALALGEVSLADWWRVIRREFFSGLLLGTVLGAIGLSRIFLWSLFSQIYGPHWVLVGLTIFFSLIGVVMWGTLAGSMLPLLLKRLGFDPAVSSAPFVATLVDVTGLVIYFSIALLLLQGTLL